ncbi:uncharacterized protein ARMOST_08423 [Armillaria ostoyae]|uniref:Uncharacterized protein n=1 Tax=Armillaria ostoyae TaxID=47428 RepID=A0A284R8K0_ARMOS|nr:uncharacterized protein ARMOST_08423 [Armillaria ostoyae]
MHLIWDSQLQNSGDLPVEHIAVAEFRESKYVADISDPRTTRFTQKPHVTSPVSSDHNQSHHLPYMLQIAVKIAKGCCPPMSSVIDADYYNMRVRLHLQQILILQSLRENAHQEVEGKGPGTKFWLNRLYEALYPPHHVFGSVSDIALSTIPEATKEP